MKRASVPVRNRRDDLPHPRLRAYIERYWVEERVGRLDRSRPFRIMPDGSAHLIFRIYGDEGRVVEQAYPVEGCSLRFVGARSIYKDIDLRRRARTLVIRFRPGGARAFFAPPATELCDRSFDLETLWRTDGDVLLNQLVEARTKDAQIACLNQVFLERLVSAERLDLPVQQAIEHLRSVKGGLTVRALADRAGLGERQFRTRFQDAVGVSPKTCARIFRVKYALRLACQEPRPSWASLAVAANFYDQAHMIRDFQALLGESPETFLNRLSQ